MSSSVRHDGRVHRTALRTLSSRQLDALAGSRVMPASGTQCHATCHAAWPEGSCTYGECTIIIDDDIDDDNRIDDCIDDDNRIDDCIDDDACINDGECTS